jgi:hypothetical protein
MHYNQELVQPATFIKGVKYFWLEGRGFRQVQGPAVPVQFSSYDPCPAFIIIVTEIGKKYRCPREAVFAEVEM